MAIGLISDRDTNLSLRLSSNPRSIIAQCLDIYAFALFLGYFLAHGIVSQFDLVIVNPPRAGLKVHQRREWLIGTVFSASCPGHGQSAFGGGVEVRTALRALSPLAFVCATSTLHAVLVGVRA